MVKSPFDEDERNHASGMLVWGIVCFGLGLTVLINGAVCVFPDMSNIDTLASLWSSGGGTLDSISVLFLEIGTGVGAGVLVFGLVGVASYFLKSRKVAAIAMAFVTGMSLVQIAGGALYLGLMSRSEEALLIETSQTGEPGEATAEVRAFLDTAIAIFNRCCDEPYGSSTDPLLTNAPPDGIDLTSEFQPGILECGVNVPALGPLATALGQAIQPQIWTCFIPESYEPIFKEITTLDLCPVFNEMEAPLDDDETVIPTTTVNLKFFLEKGGLIREEDSLGNFVIAGFPAYYAPPGLKGSGCGLMHAKGVAWAQNLFIQKVGAVQAPMLIGCGSVQIAAVLFAIALWVIGGDDPAHEEWMDYDRKVGPVVGQSERVEF